ncbi:MAG: hypothetical protein MZV64_00235 [Ignavibacteriales bacterium]|nr:hypothetical protein [Ignavibacteriales bacterium]
MCGPLPMIQAFERKFLEAGVPAGNIHFRGIQFPIEEQHGNQYLHRAGKRAHCGDETQGRHRRHEFHGNRGQGTGDLQKSRPGPHH